MIDHSTAFAASDRRRIERDILAKIRGWQAMLLRLPARGRSVLEAVLTERLIFAPRETFYEIQGVGSLGRVIAAALPTTTVVTPAGFDLFDVGEVRGIMRVG